MSKSGRFICGNKAEHCKAWMKGCTRRSDRCWDQTIYTSSVYVKMGQLSVSALFRQLPKGTTYLVMTTLCWLSMCLMLDWPTYSWREWVMWRGRVQQSLTRNFWGQVLKYSSFPARGAAGTSSYWLEYTINAEILAGIKFGGFGYTSSHKKIGSFKFGGHSLAPFNTHTK